MELRCTTYNIDKMLTSGKVNSPIELLLRMPIKGHVIIDLAGFDKGFVAILDNWNDRQVEGTFVHMEEYPNVRFRIPIDTGTLRLEVTSIR